MKKEMLINALQPEETRIAVVENGNLEELYVERDSQEDLVGNIYKGKVVNLEPSIQAAFVDFGVGRNGFLHISDVEAQYFPDFKPDFDDDRGGRRKPRNERSVRNKPPIQEVFKRGSEVLVQVIKEGIGTKGPTLSTYISIPGRYLVLMPGLQRVGVSRKIEDEDERRELKRILRDIDPPKGLGFIIRTAGVGRSADDLQRDLDYLVRLWKRIVRRIEDKPAPVDVYEESDVILRTIRDIYSADIDTIWIDEERAYNEARDFMRVIMPGHVDRVKRYSKSDPMLPPLQGREPNRPGSVSQGRLAGRRFDRHRPDRSAGRDRCELGHLSVSRPRLGNNGLRGQSGSCRADCTTTSPS